MFASTQALPVASSEGRIRDWHSVPSLGGTTELHQGTAHLIFKFSRCIPGGLKVKKIQPFFFFFLFSLSLPFSFFSVIFFYNHQDRTIVKLLEYGYENM